MIPPSDGQRDRRTDGRTDRRAIAYTRYSIYAVARKNGAIFLKHCVYGPTTAPTTQSKIILTKIVRGSRVTV